MPFYRSSLTHTLKHIHLFLTITLHHFTSLEGKKHVFFTFVFPVSRTYHKLPSKCWVEWLINEGSGMFSNTDSNQAWTYIDCGKGTTVFGFLSPVAICMTICMTIQFAWQLYFTGIRTLRSSVQSCLGSGDIFQRISQWGMCKLNRVWLCCCCLLQMVIPAKLSIHHWLEVESADTVGMFA